TGGTDLPLKDAEEVATALTYELEPHADVIWGASVRNDMAGKIRVLAIMTGVKTGQILGTRQSYKTLVEAIESKRAHPKAVELPQNRRAKEMNSGGGILEWV
ncbi:MAG: cell division protein FtsZ, partial [Methanoregula sp.]